MQSLQNAGAYEVLYSLHSFEDLQNAINQFDPADFDYPTDGVIIEHNDLENGRSLGSTGHHENSMIAFKWNDDTYDTKFIGV